MADRNPNIPHERRMDVEDKTRANEREDSENFAQRQARLEQEAETHEDEPKPGS